MSNSLTHIMPRRSPNIPRPLDNTAVSAFADCPKKYDYSMVQHRRREGALSPALAYGTSFHAALEAHYKTGGDQHEVMKAIAASWVGHERPEDHRTMERVAVAYRGYVKRWGDHDTEAKNYGMTVGFPGDPLVEISAEASWDDALHPYTGKIDRIFEQHGLYYVQDHKTTSALGSYYFSQFDPNNQMMGYAWLAQKLTGLPIAGVQINAHGVLKTQDKFERGLVSVSQDRLLDWAANYNAWVEQIEASMVADSFRRNFNACAGKYGQCTYTSVCSSSPRIRQAVLESEFVVHEWNPLATTDDANES